GPGGMSELIYSLAAALADWSAQRTGALLISDSRLAMIWENCARNDAIRVARECLGEVRGWSQEQFPLACGLTLSAGLATLEFAPKNYPPHELIEAAQRCLTGAQLSGGDTVKSITF